MNGVFHDLAVQQLSNTASRIVVIHPRYRYQKHLLWRILEQPRTIYVRFDGKQLTDVEAQEQLRTALNDQHGSSDFSGVQTLILDECDRVDAEMLHNVVGSIFSEFLSQADTDTRMIVISRTVPAFVWEETEYRQHIGFLPVYNNIGLADYVRAAGSNALLEVQAFGQGRVFLNGEEITQWDGHLPRSLFFFIVDKGMVTRNEIFDIFWPNLTVREATNVFHVTKRKISEVLGVDLTTYWSGFYRVSSDIDLNYDAMQFSQLIQDSSIETGDAARNMLRQAVSLYRGEFMESLDLPWVAKRRDALLQTYGEALVNLIHLTENSTEVERYLALYLRYALGNPQREMLIQYLMSLFAELEMYEQALGIYDRFLHELKITDSADRSADLKTLAETLRKQLG